MRKLLDSLASRLGYVPNSIVRTISCAWCGKDFQWSGPVVSNHAIYCSPLHKKRAAEARTKRRRAQEPQPKKVAAPKPVLDLNTVGRCPTPFKQTHPTFEKAKEVIKRVDPDMHAYRCPCGGIHIGH